jgi:uncharacterized MAPEG superfamily protein
MATELSVLAWAIVLGLVHLFWASAAARRQDGLEWAMGPRDEPRPALTGMAGRLERARANFMETFPFFAALVLIAVLAGRTGPLTWWGCELYFWARVAFLPVYAFGIPKIRSLIWGISMVGLILVLLGVLIG